MQNKNNEEKRSLSYSEDIFVIPGLVNGAAQWSFLINLCLAGISTPYLKFNFGNV